MPVTKYKLKSQVCTFFSLPGGCRTGASCRFVHDAAEESAHGLAEQQEGASLQGELDHQNDEFTPVDSTLLEPPAGLLEGSYRCFIDRRALAKWVPQRGKRCAAAVVAGALNSIHVGLDLTLENAMFEFQSSWEAQIDILQSEITEFLDEENEAILEEMIGILTSMSFPATHADGFRATMCSLSPDPAVQEQLAILTQVAMSYAQLSTRPPSRASTACVGVPQLMCALDNLSVFRARREVDVRILMDRGRLHDGAWQQLWNAFAAGKTEGDGEGEGGEEGGAGSPACIILHLPRHYALVFGMREYTSTEGRPVREVLSARRKQKPKEWLDFENDIVPLMTGEDGNRCQFVSVRPLGPVS